MLGRRTWALSSFDRAHALAREILDADPAQGTDGRCGGGDAPRRPARVLRHCRAGLADLERHRGALGSTELRVLASAHGVELGQIALRMLTRSSRPSMCSTGWSGTVRPP